MQRATLIREKVAQAITLLREFSIDCWITFVRETAINGDPTLDFLVGSDLTWQSAIILTSSGRTCAIVGQYDKKMVEETGAYQDVVGFVEGINEAFLATMRDLAPRTIAVNYSQDSEICDGLTHGMYLNLIGLLREIGMDSRLVSAEVVISALRQRKTSTEIGYVRGAVAITEEIFRLVARYITPGMTEQQVAEFMRKEVETRKVGFAWEPATCPAVFTGPDTAAAHYTPTGRVIEPGHVLNMDFGVRSNDYVSDLQRTFYIMESNDTGVPADVQKGFDTIRRSIESARKAMKPGVPGLAIDAIARETIVHAGYEGFPHALGHQVGRYAHDGTALLGPAWEKYGRKPFQQLEEGMVFTLEPRLTVEGRGVVTIEEMVVVTPSGAEYLSTPQETLLLVPSVRR
jgi:Xaa-Pro aminopeptidase